MRKVYDLLLCIIMISGFAGTVWSQAALKQNTVIINSRVSTQCYLRENTGTIVFGNTLVEYTFDKKRGGALTDFIDKRNPAVKFHMPEGSLTGEWTMDIVDRNTVSSAATTYEKGEYTPGKGESALKLFSHAPNADLVQIYSLQDNGSFLKCRCVYKNLSSEKVMLGRYGYSVAGLAIGGSMDDNNFIYPPAFLHFMRGNLKDATVASMNNRYIYGYLQPTDKIMLPYTMTYNGILNECVTISAVNSRTKAWIGVLGGDSASMRTAFDLYKFVGPGETQDIGISYLALHNTGWQKSMVRQRDLLMREAGYAAPKRRPDFVNDLVILWDGFPGVGINTFDDLASILPGYKAAGVNALIIGGRTWYCYFDKKPESGIEGFIPVPKNGRIVPSELSGGEAGLKRLVAKAHSLGMKLFTWGPTSLAGIDNHSDEATTQPDWWIYNKDGQLNRWYRFMLPPDSHLPGWHEFYLANVRRVVKDYGIDGFWLDSSWQDHGLNYKAPDGWYGGPNGAKASLIGDIVDAAKEVNPNVVVMSEGSGAEIMSRVDISYLQIHGIWPAIKPEEVQGLVVAQELNRIPGMRPFGQLEMGVGFYGDLGDKESRDLANKYQYSWQAKSFLVSTLDRVPVYFGFNWPIGTILSGDKAPEVIEGTENNPERLKAERERGLFEKWFVGFKAINKIRAENPEIRRGETIFDCIEVSSPSIVHYIRHLPGKDSVILLNADNVPQTVRAKISNPRTLGLSAGKKYNVRNLMTGDLLKTASGGTSWSGSEICKSGVEIALDDYQGVVLKVIPIK